MRKQFMIKEGDFGRREEFYDYIEESYFLHHWYPFDKEKYIQNSFPFVVDFENNSFWVCDSITCCAAAASHGILITIDEFKEIVGKQYMRKK